MKPLPVSGVLQWLPLIWIGLSQPSSAHPASRRDHPGWSLPLLHHLSGTGHAHRQQVPALYFLPSWFFWLWGAEAASPLVFLTLALVGAIVCKKVEPLRQKESEMLT